MLAGWIHLGSVKFNLLCGKCDWKEQGARKERKIEGGKEELEEVKEEQRKWEKGGRGQRVRNSHDQEDFSRSAPG